MNRTGECVFLVCFPIFEAFKNIWGLYHMLTTCYDLKWQHLVACSLFRGSKCPIHLEISLRGRDRRLAK